MFYYKEKLQFARYSWSVSRDMFFRYRFDPVPHTTRKYKRHVRGWFRSGIDCLSEQSRWIHDYEEMKEFGFTLSYRRSPMNMLDSWDDIPVSENHIKSWKRTKKRRQWE